VPGAVAIYLMIIHSGIRLGASPVASERFSILWSDQK
jgi:hypothetical protein